tara:strand:- start:519 stop:650 length:132 start_codon:yes stop_codon:yes gene_type:complete
MKYSVLAIIAMGKKAIARETSRYDMSGFEHEDVMDDSPDNRNG